MLAVRLDSSVEDKIVPHGKRNRPEQKLLCKRSHKQLPGRKGRLPVGPCRSGKGRTPYLN